MVWNSRTMINLLVASDLSQRMRSALEFGAVAGLLMFLTVLAVSWFESYVIKAQVAEALGLSSSVRGDMIAYRAERGEWPTTAAEVANGTLAEKNNIGNYVDHMELGPDGALTAVFRDSSATRLKNRHLTFRPLTLPADPSAPVAWVCGPHQYPAELVPGGIDETDVTPSDLPSACRNY